MSEAFVDALATFTAVLLMPAISMAVVIICGTSAARRSHRSRTNQSGPKDFDRRSKHSLLGKSETSKKETSKLKFLQDCRVDVSESHKKKSSENSSKQLSSNKLKTACDRSRKSQSTKSTAPSISSKDSVFALPFGLDVDHVLKVTPASLRYCTEKVLRISLINQSAETIAIKTKCSDNKIYRVSPVYFVLEPNSSTVVSVQRDSKIDKVDKLAFFIVKVSKGTKNAARAFAKAKGASLNELKFVVPLFVDAVKK